MAKKKKVSSKKASPLQTLSKTPVKKKVSKKVVKKALTKPPTKTPVAAKKSTKTSSQKAKKSSSAIVVKTAEILDPEDTSTTKKPVHVAAEIVDNNSLATRGSNELAPLADGLRAYLANVNKYPLLSREQEEIIAKRYYELKDPKDAEVLVTSNLRFVVKVAAEYAKYGNRLLDVIQEGNVGLMHAVKEFNPYKGVRLITYAVWWIRGYIQEYLMRQHSMVRIGTTQNQRKLFYHLKKEKNMLDQLGQESSVQILAQKLGVPEDDVRMMEERMAGGDISLDAPLSDDSSTNRLDLESDDGEQPLDDQLAHMETLKVLEDKIDHLRPQLSDKEILILNERLLADNPITLQDIGEKWGVTREAVRQMEARLINKIKDAVLEDS